jgi:uncharacterized protein
MFFTLTELEHHPILFEVTYAPGEVQLGEELHQQGGLEVSGKAELLRNTLGEIRLRGHAKVVLETNCDLCLDPANINIDNDFDLFYRPVEKTETHGEIHLEEGEVEISFYEGDGVGLRDALREFILLSVPMRAVCKEDCKGLCPNCGRNRNEGPCGCNTKRIDPRLAALKNIS